MLQIFKDAEQNAIKTFIGMALIKFAAGIMGTWGTINIYFFSFLKHHGQQINKTTNSVVLLCVVIPTAFTVLIANTLSKKFGYKLVIRICSLVCTISPFMINFRLTLSTLSLFILLIPVCCFTISSVPILNCLWSHYPNHLNKVSGAAVFFFAIGNIIYNIIFTLIINPHNEKAQID